MSQPFLPIPGAMPAPRAGRRGRAATLATLLLALSPTPAIAEPYPVPQHVNFGADWTEGLRPEDLSPSRAVTCIVDSGTAITPDTPADSPDGPIMLRTSIDPSVPPAPPSEGGAVADHGTYMAAAAIAPRNSWGTVGLQPLGRVVTVRALAENSRTFSIDDLQRGVGRCLVLRRNFSRISTISLSLAKVNPGTEQERLQFAEAVSRARALGVAVIAAAGDEASTATGWPAAAPGVVAVTAAGPNGALCSYAPRDERVDIAGPGCAVLEPASLVSGASVIDDAAGSSTATAWVAQAITLLCDLAPTLNGVRAEQLVLDSARAGGALPTLNLAVAAEAAGAAHTVAVARGRLNALPGNPQDPPSHSAPGGALAATKRPTRLLVRNVTARWRRPVLVVSARGREAGGAMQVRIYRGEGAKRVAVLTVNRRSGRAVMRLKHRPTSVGVRMLPSSDSTRVASGLRLVRVKEHIGARR